MFGIIRTGKWLDGPVSWWCDTVGYPVSVLMVWYYSTGRQSHWHHYTLSHSGVSSIYSDIIRLGSSKCQGYECLVWLGSYSKSLPATRGACALSVRPTHPVVRCWCWQYVCTITHNKGWTTIKPSISTAFFVCIRLLNWFSTVLVWCIYQAISVRVSDAFAFAVILY